VAQQRTITLHTDGACKGNPGPGAWAAILEDDEKRLCLAGRVFATTNQEMELTAVVRGLKIIKGTGARVFLYMDSEYIVRGINEWLPGWKARGWKKSDKQPVAHKELWQELDELLKKHEVICEWVRGHNGHAGNEAADALANRALKVGAIREQEAIASAG